MKGRSKGSRPKAPPAFEAWDRERRPGKRPPIPDPPGYLLRLAREDAGLTQRELARRLARTQQAVAQAERWESNPTVGLMRRWARACGRRLALRID